MKMQLSGVETIHAAKADVYAFVTDPNRVGRCLPDLQELEVTGGSQLVAHVRMGIGPIRGRFKLAAELDASRGEQIGMTLKGSGMGNGLTMTSTMRVEAAADGTTALHWSADASVSGPLAGVGGRLLEGQAKKTTTELFANIRQALEAAS